MKVRVGIDVGGTFTDAVAVDNESFELIGSTKVKTTHNAEEGVAKGIIEAVEKLMRQLEISPKDILFIAHGTTQATNALLEGDVSEVGILAAGSGLEGIKVKSDSSIDKIELAKDRYLLTHHKYIDLSKDYDFKESIKELIESGSEVIVGSTAFAVDNPEVEEGIIESARQMGIPSTATNDVSKLYGLKTRTRTAVINASILPKMIETAELTADSISKSGITAPLMIMRCDGGVMDIEEVKKRPILTLLSGPPAGVAGTLMHEKVSNGIFMEVGGTSTDISVIKDGKVMVDYAEVGGHKTYLSSLDVRTTGIAGGSMVRIDDNGVVDVGPRSAHIAGLDYSVYAEKEIINPTIKTFKPLKGDPSDYCSVISEDGEEYAITVSCAANLLGYVNEEDYSYGNIENVKIAFGVFAKKFNISVEEFAEQIMEKASAKNKPTIDAMIRDYKLDKDTTLLIGGGGGASAIVPAFAKSVNMNHKIAKNSEVISPLGVALAMIRDVVERNIINPTKEDITRIRFEAEQQVIKAGANPDTVEVFVEIDTTKNIVRAIGTGASELKTKDLKVTLKNRDEIIEIAKSSLKDEVREVNVIKQTESFYFIEALTESKGMLFFKRKEKPVRVIDNEGVIRLQKSEGSFESVSASQFNSEFEFLVDLHTRGTDGGIEIPMTYLFVGKKIIDLSGIIEKDHLLSLAQIEMAGNKGESVVALFTPRGI